MAPLAVAEPKPADNAVPAQIEARTRSVPSEHMRCWSFCFFLLVGLFLAASPLRAASLYDPAIVYRTVTSKRFAVHYPPHTFNTAVRVARLAEEILAADANLLGFMPSGTIDIVLTDSQDDANGSAEVWPHNCLRLYLAAPTELTGLASYDDWLRILLTHELAHIVDIDHSRGVTRALRTIFGKTIALNGSMPQYLSEGVAVWTETKGTAFGRGRSSYVDMILRMAALEHKFVSIDQAHILFARFPFGNAAYFYGGRFHLYLSERLGDDSIKKLHTFYASQPLPWLYLPGALKVYGASLETLWRDFAASEAALAAEVRANVEANPMGPPPTELFSHGGDILGARYIGRSRDVLHSRVGSYDGSTVRRFVRQTPGSASRSRRLFRDTASPRFAPDPQRTDDFVYSMASITHRFDTFNDLFLYDSHRRRRRKLFDVSRPKTSLRARDPAVSPDGQRLIFVQTALHQSWLTEATLERERDGSIKPGLTLRTLVGPHGDMQQASPAFHPSGDLLAVSTFFPGGKRDIVLLDSHTGAVVRRLTYDTAQDGNPSFTPDGRFVLYESDSDGISNIYAYELANGAYYRITHVVGGAFQPDVSPDGTSLLFRQAIGGGFAVHELPYAPATWQPVAYAAQSGYAPLGARPPTAAGLETAVEASNEATHVAWRTEPWPAATPRALEPPLALEAGEREGPYRPLRGLVPYGDNWLLVPSVYWYNGTLGAAVMTLAQDSLRRHTWSLSAGGMLHVRRPNITASYTNDVLLPTLSASANYLSTLYRFSFAEVIETSASSGLRTAWPWGRRHQVALSYAFEYRQAVTRPEVAWPVGRFANVGLSYRYGFARSFPYSISFETGRSIALGIQAFSRFVGSGHEQIILSADARGFLNNPWLANHVLALRLAAFWSFGRDAAQKFFLYGNQATSLFTSQSPRLLPLRGFFPGRGVGAPAPGDGVMALYAEYRFPLWHIQRGIFSWPLFFEHLHLAAFADAGNTLGTSDSASRAAIEATASAFLRQLWLSAGAELRLDLVLSWAAPLTLRVGVAEPLLARGVAIAGRGALPAFYFNVGSMF